MSIHDIQVPKMGMGSSDVDVISVLANVGDQVQPTSPLIEIESEKASFMIESEIAGKVVEVLVSEGQVVEIGTVVVRIEADE